MQLEVAKINENYAKLAAGYLFPEINRRVAEFKKRKPEVEIFRLGIGNTTEPLPPHIVSGLAFGAEKLSNKETYTGYGEEQGDRRLRIAITQLYQGRGISLDPSEVFVGDGAKTDVANIQSIFSLDNLVAVQDPAYPVYVDTNVASGRTGTFDKATGQYQGMLYMPCTERNGFIPLVPEESKNFPDLIYLCSPNNPTGAVMSRKDLEGFVSAAKRNKSIILFDAAYSWFISDTTLPQSIYEIPGAEEVAIEFNSFSKLAGFTGVRLGWTVVPKSVSVEDVEPGRVHALWNRRQTTFFNGASNVAQEGGLYALSVAGRRECQGLVDFYMGNARVITSGLKEIGITIFGGTNAPYVWMKNPENMNSWEFFDKMLDEAHVVTTPGSGFGPAGEGFTRLSAFSHRENIIEAITSIQKKLKL